MFNLQPPRHISTLPKSGRSIAPPNVGLRANFVEKVAGCKGESSLIQSC